MAVLRGYTWTKIQSYIDKNTVKYNSYIDKNTVIIDKHILVLYSDYSDNPQVALWLRKKVSW